MNPEIKKQWVEALRSGEYKQGRYCLRDDENKFCCLGVLSDLYIKQGNPGEWELNLNKTNYIMHIGEASSDGYLPKPVMDWAGLPNENPLAGSYRLSLENDSPEKTFSDIANLIEKEL